MQSIRRLVSLSSSISTKVFHSKIQSHRLTTSGNPLLRALAQCPASVPVAQKQFLSTTPACGIKASKLTEENLPPCIGCPICSRGISFEVTDVLLLSQFMTPEGGMFPRRITGLCKGSQRNIMTKIHLARRMGLLPRVPPTDGGEPPVRRLQSRSQVKRTDKSNVFNVPMEKNTKKKKKQWRYYKF